LDVPEFEEYYRCLKYDLNGLERRGLKPFYSYLTEAGELEDAPRLETYRPVTDRHSIRECA
jgi:predicted solute-binding protein